MHRFGREGFIERATLNPPERAAFDKIHDSLGPPGCLQLKVLTEGDRESAKSGLPKDPALYDVNTLLEFQEELTSIKAAQEELSESDEGSETDGLEDSDHSGSEPE